MLNILTRIVVCLALLGCPLFCGPTATCARNEHSVVLAEAEACGHTCCGCKQAAEPSAERPAPPWEIPWEIPGDEDPFQACCQGICGGAVIGKFAQNELPQSTQSLACVPLRLAGRTDLGVDSAREARHVFRCDPLLYGRGMRVGQGSLLL